MSMPSASPFIIISAPYATSVPLYLKTWPKWLRVLSLAPASVLFGATQKNISKLQKAQNLLARVVTCSPQSCSARTLLQQLHWLPTEHRIDFKIANITFRTLHCSQPAYLRSSLHACHSTRSLRLSNTDLLSAPFVRTSFGSRSFSVAAPKIWNSLPLSLRTCTSPDTFRLHQDPLLPAGLPLHLTPLLLRLRFGFADHCAFINYIYLLTYLHSYNKSFQPETNQYLTLKAAFANQ